VLDGGGDAGDEELCRAQSSAVQVLFVRAIKGVFGATRRGAGGGLLRLRWALPVVCWARYKFCWEVHNSCTYNYTSAIYTVAICRVVQELYKVVQLAKGKPARGARVSRSARRVPTGHFSSLVTLTAAYLIQPYFVFLSLFVIELKKHPMRPAVFCTIINNVFEL
jgi:hypothetical protein